MGLPSQFITKRGILLLTLALTLPCIAASQDQPSSTGQEWWEVTTPPPKSSPKLRKAPSSKPYGEFKTMDLTLGVNGIFPMVSHQFGLSRRFALGASFMIVDWPTGDKTVHRGWSGQLTLNLYSKYLFVGAWLQAGIGILNSQKGLPNSPYRSLVLPHATLTAGWRWLLEDGMNIGFAVGANAIPKKINQDSPSEAWLIPTIVLDWGFTL